MDKTLIEKRQFPRITATLPIRISSEFLGETVDLSETGLKFVLEKPLLLSKAQVQIELSPKESIETEFKVIWNKHLVKENKFTYGVCLIRIKEKDIDILRDVLINAQMKNILEKVTDLSIKNKIQDFCKYSLKKYISEVVKLTRKIEENTISKDEAECNFFSITDEIMQKAEGLELSIRQKLIIKGIKQIFRELVGNWIYKGIIVRKAFEKQQGYPGDYKVIEDIYNNQSFSEGIGYYSDRYFLENEYAVAVRNRKQRMKEILRNFIETSVVPSIKILNIACGSCREIKELFIDNNFTTKKEVNFTLVDQDKEALEFSKEILRGCSSKISFQFLQHNILTFINDNNKYSKILGKQDLIYSVGLADYLPDRVLKEFLLFCFNLTNKGGKLIITHKDTEKCHSVAPDWFCDWNFYSRTENSLVELIKSLNINNLRIEAIVREQSNRILFIVIVNT